MRWLLFLILLSGLLVGCATSPDPDTKTNEDQYLVYTRSGGMMGKSNTWTVYRDGRITSDNSTRYEANPEDTEALFKQIPLPLFIEQSKVTPDPHCADCTNATLVYQTGGKSYQLQLVIETAAPQNPATAWIDQLETLLAKAAR